MLASAAYSYIVVCPRRVELIAWWFGTDNQGRRGQVAPVGGSMRSAEDAAKSGLQTARRRVPASVRIFIVLGIVAAVAFFVFQAFYVPDETCLRRVDEPLYDAARSGDVARAKLFVALGANVNASDYHGWTPLGIACHAGQTAMVRFFIGHGAKPRSEFLIETAIAGKPTITALLLDHGARADSTQGCQALAIAQMRGENAMVALLRRYGATMRPGGA